MKSQEWEDFSSRFADSAANANLLTMAYIDKLGTEESVDERLGLLRNILRGGGIISLRTIKNANGQVLLNAGHYEFELKPETEPVVEEPAPVHRGQQLWSEYRQFSESHSIQDCRNRAKVDAGFASFMRKNYQREARETDSTQFPLAGQPSANNKRDDPTDGADRRRWYLAPVSAFAAA